MAWVEFRGLTFGPAGLTELLAALGDLRGQGDAKP
jgi:hypothetical protein